MTWARACDRHRFRAIVGIGGHLFSPIFEVAIFDNERDRTADRFAKANPGDGAHFVFFDQHPAAAAIAFLAAREVAVDFGDVDVEAGGDAFNYRDQLGAVRFAGSQKTQHRLCSILCVRLGTRAPYPDSTRLAAPAKAGGSLRIAQKCDGDGVIGYK